MVWHDWKVKCRERKDAHDAENVILSQTMKEIFLSLKRVLNIKDFICLFFAIVWKAALSLLKFERFGTGGKMV